MTRPQFCLLLGLFSGLLLGASPAALANVAEEEKQQVAEACKQVGNGMVSRAIALTMEEFVPSASENAADILQDWESYNFICSLAAQHGMQDMKPDVRRGIDLGLELYRGRLQQQLAVEAQPICQSYLDIAVVEVRERWQKWRNNPFVQAAHARGISVVLQMLVEGCEDQTLKNHLAQTFQHAQYVEVAGFGYYRCRAPYETFRAILEKFDATYFERANAEGTAEAWFDQALSAGQTLAASNCLPQKAEAEQMLGQAQAMLQDPNRDKQVACDKAVVRYDGLKKQLRAQDGIMKRWELFEEQVKPAGFEAVRTCGHAPQRELAVENDIYNTERWLRSLN